MPIHLKENLVVELALMHIYRITTVLPFSKYASPIFAQRKSNVKLRLFADLRIINTLIADDYTNNNHPVSTLSDAAQHLKMNSLFCKLECYEVFHCLLMVDHRSVEIIAFNFVSTTFAYKRFAQDLSIPVSVSSNIIPWTHLTELTNELKTWMRSELQPKQLQIFQCVRQAELKLTTGTCQFWVRQVEFLGRTISAEII